MRLCSDPLQTVRRVGSNQQWCVSLPACYPTIIPYVSTNIEYNGQETSNTATFHSGFNNYDSANILDSPICANSEIIQRIRHKVNLYQTPSSKDAHQILQRLTNIVKQHVPEFIFKEVTDGDVREQINQPNQNISPTSSSVASQSKSPSFLQQVFGKKSKDDHVLPTDSSHHSHLSNGSLHSTNLSSLSIRTNENSRQFSPIQSLQSLSKINGISDHTDRESIVMSISVPSLSATPYVSDQELMSSELRQAVHNIVTTKSQHDNSPTTVSIANINDRHPDSSHVISAIDLKSSIFLSPSPTISMNNLGQQELLTQSTTSTYLDGSPSLNSQYSNQDQQRVPEITLNDETEKQKSWFKRLMKKVSSKHFSTTSFQDATSHRYMNDQNKTRPVQLHMKEALAALELDLTKEAFQALISKKKDYKQNTLMHILTVPSRCCRSCRTQRRLVSLAQRSINVAIKNL